MERNGPGQQSSGDQRDPALVDLERLRHGGIPVHAEERLRELGHTGPGALAFTSDLSPDEAGLLRQRGYQPLGLVTGSAVYHVGFAYASAYQDTEVAQLSAAYNEATRLAVGRLSQEAHLAGAEGVVGVRYTMTRHEWTERVIEVQLVGTAVRGPHGQPQSPWLSDLIFDEM
ncbi:MAG: heavy metal-binding domain-containing protein, partial [Chloroflexi bacterium]|nr:heavy metal-binding domain-containing protein [Chloroflexota bacterium]